MCFHYDLLAWEPSPTRVTKSYSRRFTANERFYRETKFSRVSRVPQSKFEANWSRGSWVMLGKANKQRLQFYIYRYGTGCSIKHGNSVTNSRSSLLWISIVRPDFKSPNIIMSARVYFIKMIKDFKYVSHVSARWTVQKTDKFTLLEYWNFLVVQPYAVKT